MTHKDRVLIVDDEQDVVDLLRYNLEKAGYRTFIAKNGVEAIEAARRFEPELVLLDIMLPELDGWEVCRTLRSTSAGRVLPVIMISALTDEESRVKGLVHGADDYLSKPFAIKELLLKIHKHLDRARTVKSLREKEQEQTTSLNYLIHELKNSVSVIGNFSTLAMMNKDAAARYLKTIQSTSLHAENLLNDASLLARLEQEGGTLSAAEVDPGVIAKDVAELFRVQAAVREIEIVLGDAPATMANGHRTALRQVLVNLVSNAIKYNRPGGKVRIAFDETDTCIDISVHDEGYGMPAEELPRIFGKFYRCAGSERLKGAGLGLYIVRLLTEAMGGSVTVASTGGAGSVFTVSLPKAATGNREAAIPVEGRVVPAA
jgi:two-component system, sensor histidine kinase and response regulator